MIFDYELPVAAAAKPDKKKKGDDKKKKDKGGPVKTQMIPENPADDLGYDPDKIPTEKID